MAVVVESFEHLSRGSLLKKAGRAGPVYVLERFVAYHYQDGPCAAFPKPLPDFVGPLLAEGSLKLLLAADLEAKTIYGEALDLAVEVVEAVFPAFREDHEAFCRHVRDAVDSEVGEWVYRRYLAEKLAEFYSTNILLARVEKWVEGPIEFHPHADVQNYLYMMELLERTGQPFDRHPRTRLIPRAGRHSRFAQLKRSLVMTAKVCLQTLGSALMGWRRPRASPVRRDFRYGVTVVAPSRQLRGHQRGVDFFVDGRAIKPDEIVLLLQAPLTDEQQDKIRAMPYAVCDLAGTRHHFSNPRAWLRLLGVALGCRFLRNGDAIAMAVSVCFNYYRWREVLRHTRFHHLVTHCDFSVGHLGRNIALKETGAETWYFSDSMNFSWSLIEGREAPRSPLWCYLDYDHLVTWSRQLAAYLGRHPRTFRQSHVVGCLWTGHVADRQETRRRTRSPSLRDLGDRFVVVAFDTTYSLNGAASYTEAMAFAADLLRLAAEVPDVTVILKEKKARSIHAVLDPTRGPQLVEFYERMDRHPRITVCSNQQDASELVSAADVVVSFPFTSTTFEALAANRPAFWHDPLGLYPYAAYAKVPGVTTRGYEEMKARILEIKAAGAAHFTNPIPLGSPLGDPYRDNRAIERFTQLLASAE